MITACFATTDTADDEHEQYEGFLSSLRATFDAATAGSPRLFIADAANLFTLFLDALSPDRRQHYNCNACRRFVDRFGSLVAISDDGCIRSVLWDAVMAPPFFRPSVAALQRAVSRTSVTGVFLSSEPTWGLPKNLDGKRATEWHHMAVVPPPSLLFRASALQNAEQAMASRRQEFEMLKRGLADFSAETARQAHTLLTTSQLYRSEKCIGVAKWFLDLHEAREATKNARAQANLTWGAVATAPTGYAHIRSSMIGTLLEDIQTGLSFSEIKRRFDEKMSPFQYQRPQAAPSAGNVAQAEKVVAALQTAGALERRFARLEDVQALWRPRVEERKTQVAGGVFGHLKTAEKKPAERTQVEAPPTAMTWEKFARTVLPEADAIEYYVSSSRSSYAALVTAANSDAPPILQWDFEEKRNPVSWYLYHGGSFPGEWNLTAGRWQIVTAICLQPSLWSGEDRFQHQGWSVLLLLEGALDTRRRLGDGGGGFFPECLRSEYHAVRSTLEAYAGAAVVAGAEEATACGLKLQAGMPWDCLLRVTSRGGRVQYRLDRRD